MTNPQGKIAKQTWMTAPETARVMDALCEGGGDARFVGGCVRDALANRAVVDVDIATPLKPQDVIARLTKAKIKYAPTGLKHGTVTAIAQGKTFEITTLRVDVNPLGRHADVEFTDDWQADASRRDFTINAMSATVEGDVFDLFGGIRDLREGRVVFVGEPAKRIAEDHLRILRFFRFYAHFGHRENPEAFGEEEIVPPDARALDACAESAHLLSRLSPERVRQEILKLLESPHAAEVWRIMATRGIVGHILPEATEIAALRRLLGLEEKYRDGAGALRRLAALLVVNEEGANLVGDALRLSNAQREQLAQLAVPVADARPDMTDLDARKLVYRRGNDLARSLLLLAAARGGAGDNFAALHHIVTSFRPPPFPLEGGDVTRRGFTGPAVGRVLRELEDWWLDQDFRPGRGECLMRLKLML